MDGRDALKFALVQDDSGKQIDIYNGYCKCRTLPRTLPEGSKKPTRHLNSTGIAPCFFLSLDQRWNPWISTGVEFTIKCNMSRAVLERRPTIRFVLK